MFKARYHPDTPRADAHPERPTKIQERLAKLLASLFTVPKNTDPVATNQNNIETAEATIGEEKTSVKGRDCLRSEAGSG